jgi:hypothetical protein
MKSKKPNTLRDVLERHGIADYRAFATAAGLHQQQAWDLWTGKVGAGVDMLKLLHERLAIPTDELLAIEPVKPHKPRGGPRPRRTGGPSQDPLEVVDLAIRVQDGGVCTRPAEQDQRDSYWQRLERYERGAIERPTREERGQ